MLNKINHKKGKYHMISLYMQTEKQMNYQNRNRIIDRQQLMVAKGEEFGKMHERKKKNPNMITSKKKKRSIESPNPPSPSLS